MKDIDKQVINELRRVDAFYIPLTDEFILKTCGNSYSFANLRLKIAFNNLISNLLSVRYLTLLLKKL